MTLPHVVSGAGFWLATVLPLGYVPLLARGVDSLVELQILLALLAVNTIALIVGHDHHAE